MSNGKKGKRKMLDKTNLLTLYIYYIKNFNICQFFPWGRPLGRRQRQGLGLWRNLTLIIKRGKILTLAEAYGLDLDEIILSPSIYIEN